MAFSSRLDRKIGRSERANGWRDGLEGKIQDVSWECMFKAKQRIGEDLEVAEYTCSEPETAGRSEPAKEAMVLLQVNKPILNMLKLVQPYVTYGYPSLKTVRELVYKRGFGKASG